MCAPMRSYERLLEQRERASMAVALRRPALLAVVIGASLTMSATGRADAPTLLSVTLYWSVVPAMQLLIALVLVRSASGRLVSMSRAIDLCFMANGPWSLWFVASAGWSLFTLPLARPMAAVLLAAAIPGAWTPVLMFSFCRTVLNDPAPRALRRTIAHQAAIWTIVVVAIAEAVQLWPRILAWSGR